jgi:CRP/FNR family cyclic AMP-dependent transcriptional regulator
MARRVLATRRTLVMLNSHGRDSAGIPHQVVKYPRGSTIFRQGDSCDRVIYLQAGAVKLSVTSRSGREAILATLGPGDFFGEGGLVSQPFRTSSASAITPTTLLLIDTDDMVTLLREQRELSDQFIANVLSRKILVENDLLDQLFNSAEKRIARALIMLTGGSSHDEPGRIPPWLSQTTLAEKVGTTRSRVNFFLNRFKRFGFIESQRDHTLTVNRSLLRTVLRD